MCCFQCNMTFKHELLASDWLESQNVDFDNTIPAMRFINNMIVIMISCVFNPNGYYLMEKLDK